MNLAAYARYSTDMQRHESITAQMRAIEAYCEDNGHKIVSTYVDEAVSGKTTLMRPQFMRMLSDARRHEFDGIIVYYISRLSRSLEDHVLLERDLRKIGIPILSVKEPDGDTPNGRMVRGIMQVLSEHESNQLAERVAYGMRESALQCKFMGGIVPLGWDVVNGYFVINEKEARSVQEAFSMYADGASLNKVLDFFDEQGMVGRRNAKPYTKTALYEILRNRKYKGEYSFNKGKKGDHRSIRNDGETIVIKDGIPRIISDELWDKVQERNSKSLEIARKRRAARCYILSGLIYCANCGSHMIGLKERSRHEGEYYYYYRCADSMRRHGECKQLAVSAVNLENRILDAIDMYIFRDDNLEVVINQYRELLINQMTQSSTQIKEIQKKVQKLNGEINNLVNAIASVSSDKQSKYDRIKTFQLNSSVVGCEMPTCLGAFDVTPQSPGFDLLLEAVHIRERFTKSLTAHNTDFDFRHI